MAIPTTPSSELVSLGAGEIWFDPFDADGNPTGYFHFGNSPNFTLALTTEEIRIKNFMNRSRGDYVRKVREIAVDVRIATMEVSVTNMAVGLLGEVIATTQATATVTDEALTPADGVILGRAYKTTRRGISAVVVEKGGVALDLYDPVTGEGDYVISDAAGGMITILATPTTVGLADGDDLTVSYTAAALTGTTALQQISIGAKPQFNGRLFFKSDNVFGQNYDYELWNVQLKPDGELALIGEEVIQIGLAGSAQDDSAGAHGGSSTFPFGRKVFREAA